MKVYPCEMCNKPAIGCYRPDIDIKGLCFCAAHREDVMLAYMLLIQGKEEEAKEILDNQK